MSSFKHSIKIAYKNFIFNLFAKQSPFIRFFYDRLYRPQKGGISEYTDRFSKSNKDITVVQVGANDGFNHDPIFKFIFRDHWKGILLEPQPLVFKILSRLHAKNNRITPVNAAVDYIDSKRTLYSLAADERWAHGRASFSRAPVEQAISSGFFEKKAAQSGVKLPSNREEWIQETEIDCLSPKTLMERYGITKMDWLQIDTEGYDFEIIKMFNLAETKPKVVSYEHAHLSPEEMTACDAHLIANGYRILRFGGNTVAELGE